MKIIRILPINHIEIPTKLQNNKAKFSIQITSHSMLLLIFCSSVTMSQHIPYPLLPYLKITLSHPPYQIS